jgi:hypothetical protein
MIVRQVRISGFFLIDAKDESNIMCPVHTGVKVDIPDLQIEESVIGWCSTRCAVYTEERNGDVIDCFCGWAKCKIGERKDNGQLT